MWHGVALHVDPGPDVLWYYSTSHSTTRITTLALLDALLGRAPDACADTKGWTPGPPQRHHACTLTGGCYTRAYWRRLTGTLVPAAACSHAHHLDALIPIRTTRSFRSSLTPLYKISADPPRCKPVSATQETSLLVPILAIVLAILLHRSPTTSPSPVTPLNLASSLPFFCRMDSQSFDYWMAQGSYIAPPPHQTTVFEMPPDLSKVPSLSASPVCTTCEMFAGSYLIP
jgi:hypothetical protein